MSQGRPEQRALSLVLQKAEKTETETTKLIRQVTDLSEREVLEAGTLMSGILSNCQDHVTQLHALRGQLDEESKTAEATFGGVVTQQADFIASLPATFDDIARRAQNHSAQAKKALDSTTEIQRIALKIEDITSTVRMLSLNALIEATRAGEYGQSMAVVAREMKELGLEIQKYNGSISQLCDSLGELLPRLVSEADDMSSRGREQSTATTRMSSQLDENLRTTRRELSTTLQGISNDGEQIRRRCMEVLSHLQFQDRNRQDLEKAMGCIAQFVESTRNAANAPDGYESSSAPAALGRVVPPSLKHLQGEAADPKTVHEDAADSGDIEYF